MLVRANSDWECTSWLIAVVLVCAVVTPARGCGESTGALLEQSQVSLRGEDFDVQGAADSAFDTWADVWSSEVGGFTLYDMFDVVGGEPNDKYISDIFYVSAFTPCNPTPGSVSGPTTWLGCLDIDSQELSARGRMWSCDILIPDATLLANLQIGSTSGFYWVFSDFDVLDKHSLLMEAVIAHEVGHLVGVRGHMDSCGSGCNRPTMGSAAKWFETCNTPIGPEKASLSWWDTNWLRFAYAEIVSIDASEDTLAVSLTCSHVVLHDSSRVLEADSRDGRAATISSMDRRFQVELALESDRVESRFVAPLRDARWMLAAGQRSVIVEVRDGDGELVQSAVADISRECEEGHSGGGRLIIISDTARALWTFRLAGSSGQRMTGEDSLDILDLRGRRIKSVRVDEFSGDAIWVGDDESGERVAPGVYLAQTTADGRQYSAKVLVLRR